MATEGVTERRLGRVHRMESHRRDRLDPWEGRCLAALVGGDTDEVAASKLGLTRRTFRRRVKDAMDKLGARSRFQAGYRFALAARDDSPILATVDAQEAVRPHEK